MLVGSPHLPKALYWVFAVGLSAWPCSVEASLQVGWGGQNQLNNVRAVRNGMQVYDGVEIDVRATQDGVVIGLHDTTLDRETTGTGAIADQRWEDLTGITNLLGEPLAKLTDMLRVIDEHHGFVFLDVRDVPPAFIKAALDEVSFPHHQARILVFDHEQGSNYTAAIPGAPVYFKFYDHPNLLDDDVLLSQLIEVGYSGVAFPTWTAFPDLAVVEKLRNLGLFTFSFVVTTQEEANRSSELGIDQVVVNGLFHFPNEVPREMTVTTPVVTPEALTFEVEVPRLYRQWVLEELDVHTGTWRVRPTVVPARRGPNVYQVTVKRTPGRREAVFRARVVPPRGAG